jgi:hypothetical protein
MDYIESTANVAEILQILSLWKVVRYHLVANEDNSALKS